MKRVEFSSKTRAEAFLRCNGKCEACKAALKLGEGEYDHVIPYAISEDSTLANCQVLCVPCHRGAGAKTAQDQKDISKAKRREADHFGTKKPNRKAISQPTEKPDKRPSKLGSLPYRQLYREAQS